MHALPILLLALAAPAETDDIQPHLVPRAVLREVLAEWSFDAGADGWMAEKNCELSAEAGLLVIEATGHDPYLHRGVDLPGGPIVVEMRLRCRGEGAGSVFWTSTDSPHRGEDKVRHADLRHDGQWHEVAFSFHAAGRLTDLRFDPGSEAGRVEVDWIRVVRAEPHPLVIGRAEVEGRTVRFTVNNDHDTPIEFTAFGRVHTLAGQASIVVEQTAAAGRPVEPVTIELESAGLPAVRRTVFVVDDRAAVEWIAMPWGEYTIEAALDGSAARLLRAGQTVALLAPLVHRDGVLPTLRRVESAEGLRFEGEGVSVTLAARDGDLGVTIESPAECEGPVVRVLGEMEQGLFAGLEYLEKGDTSSSKLDVETDEHLRFAPDPLKVTMPLMAFVTDRVSLAMSWSDMALQPTFASPDFFDARPEHRMALRSGEAKGTGSEPASGNTARKGGGEVPVPVASPLRRIEATLHASREPLEEQILWAVRRRGLPPLPPPPRSAEEQTALTLRGLNGPLKTADGWGHCVEPHWPRRPFADMGSTHWRLTGEIPQLDRPALGGAHIRNESLFFVTGRAEMWRQIHQQQAESLLAQQRPDGSYRYAGPFQRGHWEDTASGVCARPALVLLEHAWATGDSAALEGGLKTLRYMKRFRTPRGAQVWEVPLHTPDVLASGYAVWANVRAYELTGDRQYLDEARRWALTGVPFVYQWEKYPIMLYATPPVYGATNWQSPCWIGLPVQWCGLVYAYGLGLLAPYDETLDWRRLARGILISGEQQQVPDGPKAGTLPDSIHLPTQERRAWFINPCALVSVRMLLDGQLDHIAVATGDGHRVASPFPVEIRGGKAHVRAKAGLTYQLLIDGRRVVTVESRGDDVIPLGDKAD